MSSSQRERDEFIAYAARSGLPLDVARLVLRHAATLQRHAEENCSSEWAARDRVPCPGIKIPADCICEDWPQGTHAAGSHSKVTRNDRTDQRLERRVAELVAPFRLVPEFQGDPRGYVVKLRRQDYPEESERRVGVPA